MMTNGDYQAPGPTRNEIDAIRGPLVLEFGTGWCGFCQGARPLVEAALAAHPAVPHVKVEDGPGRPLGRSFRVKLWPTLIFLRDGREVERVVRPGGEEEIRRGLKAITADSQQPG